MCGICGIYNYQNKAPVEKSALKKINDALYARGPDDEGFFIKKNVGLANKRLSIIDVAGGKQPIFNEDKTISIVYNGEIYNYRDLRQGLVDSGHKFTTNTDTEVIVHLYEEKGEECVKLLRGMFAFAIWDEKKDLLFLARDRFGIKPLCYADINGRLVFASETKAIVQDNGISKDIDFEALHYYLTYLCVPSPLTIYTGIKKLAPAHILICSKGKIIEKQYWALQPQRTRFGNVEEYYDRFYKLLKESVKAHLMSDVQLGAFLSGGIDSSSIVSIMSELSDLPVKTFSIGFKEKEFDELSYARFVARRFGTEHHELIMSANDILKMEDLIWNLDEPHANSSSLASFFVAKLANPYVKVALTGAGGDELFGGYQAYIADKLARIYGIVPKFFNKTVINILSPLVRDSQKPGNLRRIYRFLQSANLPFKKRHIKWMTLPGFDDYEKETLYSDLLRNQTKRFDSFTAAESCFDRAEAAGLDYLNSAMFVDLNTYLNNDVLQQVDRMTMASSLEARVPYLDHKLVEFAFSIPSNLKLKGLSLKYLVKQSMKGLLTDKIVNRAKHGFGVPIGEWLRSNLIKQNLQEFLNSSAIKRRGFFNPAYIQKLTANHLNGKQDNSRRLWLILILEIWCRRFLDN